MLWIRHWFVPKDDLQAFLDWYDKDWRKAHTKWFYLRSGPQDAPLERLLEKEYGKDWRG